MFLTQNRAHALSVCGVHGKMMNPQMCRGTHTIQGNSKSPKLSLQGDFIFQ